jgi:glycosyltransferase involved in cell wall biosynthesis
VDKIVEPRVPTPDMVRVLRATNAVVLPFLATMSSGTVTLALSESRPVIAPNMGCLLEVFLPGGGLLYDPNRPGALLDAMKEIRTWDLEEAYRTALASIRRYDWDRIAELTLEAYRR